MIRSKLNSEIVLKEYVLKKVKLVNMNRTDETKTIAVPITRIFCIPILTYKFCPGSMRGLGFW